MDVTNNYIPFDMRTYDIDINLGGDHLTLKKCDQTEVIRFLTLMPRMVVTRYNKVVEETQLIVTLHKNEADGDNDQ